MTLDFADRVCERAFEVKNMIKKVVVTSILTLGLVSFTYAINHITYYGISNGEQKINSINFSDVLSQGEGYWAKSAIYQISSLDIMQGMASRVFSPTTKVTNEQAITTVLNSMGKSNEVNDLKLVSNYWSDKYIKYNILLLYFRFFPWIQTLHSGYKNS